MTAQEQTLNTRAIELRSITHDKTQNVAIIDDFKLDITESTQGFFPGSHSLCFGVLLQIKTRYETISRMNEKSQLIGRIL